MTTLLDMGCKTVANMIKDKTPAQVRQIFNIPNDLPPFPVCLFLRILIKNLIFIFLGTTISHQKQKSSVL
jgi:hypothetical protein